MEKATFSQIQELLNSDETRRRLEELPLFRISILRNITVESLEPYLRFQGLQAGMNTQARFGNFDNILQDALGGLDSKNQPVLESETDLVLVFYKLEQASKLLTENFVDLKPSAIEQEIGRVMDYVTHSLDALSQNTKAMILWHAFELPDYPAFGIADARRQVSQESVVNELNQRLKTLLIERPNGFYVDSNLCLREIGSEGYYDRRFWHFGRAPYSLQGLGRLAEEHFKFVRVKLGKAKKCVVLDCDNTLWGGILGEEGPSKIKISPDGAGSPFYEFQRELLNLSQRGFLLALCSKNNEQDVLEVFKSHPGMLLREDQIVAHRINWNDKVSNIRELATELNIGLDSMVFVDDSEFEVNLVKEMIPEVHVIRVDPKQPYRYRSLLLEAGLFESLHASQEDGRRTSMYKSETKRKQAKATATDLGSYLKSLEMVLTVKYASPEVTARLSQLTQKTNQFNLTTKRYTEAEVIEFANSDVTDVIYVHLEDKWGDYGIAGVGIVEIQSEQARIDTFLLSCRVLGRGVEQGFLNEIIKHARKKGASKLRGFFCRTSKNEQVRDFYSKNSFTLVQDRDERREFELDLSGNILLETEHFKAIESEV